MHEHADLRPHTEDAVLDIGDDIGALVIYTPPAFHGLEIEVCRAADGSQRVHTAVLERHANGQAIYAALFRELPAGDYTILDTTPLYPNHVTITGGVIAEVDWRAI